MVSPEDPSVNEEVNVFIAGLPEDEKAQIIDDRKFEESLACDIVPDVGFVTFDNSMSDQQRAQAIEYLSWLKERRASANNVVDDKKD